MTCDAVREALLTADTASFGSLADHLDRCPGCAALADDILAAEIELRHHVEDFVHTPALSIDAQWDAALRRAGPRSRRRPSLWTAAVALAAAAVAATVLLPGPPRRDPPGPVAVSAGAVPAALVEGRRLRGAVAAIDTEDLDVAGLDRAAEDERHRAVFDELVAAMTAAERALVAASGEGEPQWRVAALAELGDLYRDLAAALGGFAAPSYLTAKQVTAYREGLAAKADAQRVRAAEVYTRGAALAREHGLAEAAADLDARAAAVRPTP